MSIRWCPREAPSMKWSWACRKAWRCRLPICECPFDLKVSKMLQIISLLLENKPGALMRVTGLLTQRGYNIESLTVGRTLDAALSRMTIVVDVEPQQRLQVIKQMNKLINVLQATDLTESPAVTRELVLLRIHTAQ